MRKWLIPLGLMLMGLLWSCGGLMYGSLTVGVPDPEAAGSALAEERFNVELSFWLMSLGFLVIVMGRIGMIVMLIQNDRQRKRNQSHEPIQP